MRDAGCDIKFFRRQAVNAELRVVNASACRLLSIETCQLCDRGVRVYAPSQVNGAVVAEATEALEEREVNRSQFAVGAYPKVVGATSTARAAGIRCRRNDRW